MSEISRETLEKYPDVFFEGIQTVEANVLACLAKDMSLFDEFEFVSRDFVCRDSKVIFKVISTLAKNGIDKIDTASLASYLSDKIIDMFMDLGGFDILDEMTSSVSLDNWLSYLDKMRREVMMRKLYDIGIDPTKEQRWGNEKIIPIEFFRAGTSEDIVDFYEAQIATLINTTHSTVRENEQLEFDQEWLDSLSDGTERGEYFGYVTWEGKNDQIPVYPKISHAIAGLLPGTTTMLGAYSSAGKSTFWIGLLISLASQGHKILIISNEEPAAKFKQKAIVYFLNHVLGSGNAVSKRDLSHGEISEEQKNLLEVAAELWKSSGFSERIRFISITDSDMNIVKKMVREYAVRYGYDVVLYDTFKIQVSDMKNSRTDLSLVEDSRTLDQLAKKYNLIMLASVQLAENTRGKLWLDSSTLSNSKQIKEQLENLFLMRNLYEDEMNPQSRYYCRPYVLRKSKDATGLSDDWVQEEIKLDDKKTYKILFLEKTRSGTNSSDTNSAFILEFDGDHSVFKEIGRCKPQHGNIT